MEGKYDKIKLSQFIGSLIIETNGFRIFKDKEKRTLIRSLAQKDGVIIITDSDAAGFKIRGYLKSILKDCNIINVYIPHIQGKEKRKTTPSKENLLGVEGINIDILKELFILHGVFADTSSVSEKKKVTKQDFYEDGLTGKSNSKQRRDLLLIMLNLPTYISTNALLDVINQLITYEEYMELINKIPPIKNQG